MDSLTQVTN
uniref:Uncharacterized protein n=1 Tax=Anguilla anguilla TaxID=7936 RepID=A0A0E9XD62_ANGAN